jgi:hypothetical protein
MIGVDKTGKTTRVVRNAHLDRINTLKGHGYCEHCATDRLFAPDQDGDMVCVTCGRISV